MFCDNNYKKSICVKPKSHIQFTKITYLWPEWISLSVFQSDTDSFFYESCMHWLANSCLYLHILQGATLALIESCSIQYQFFFYLRFGLYQLLREISGSLAAQSSFIFTSLLASFVHLLFGPRNEVCLHF